MATRERERAEQFIDGLCLRERRSRSSQGTIAAHVRTDGDERDGLLIEFDRESGLSGIRVPNATLRCDSPLLRHMEAVAGVLRLHTMVSRLASFDPASHGLVSSKSVTPRRFRYSDDRLEMYAEGFIPYNFSTEDLLARQAMACVPKTIREPDVVWHAHHANMHEFGTPFLAPYTAADAEIEVEEDDSMQEGWAVFQVGLENAAPLAVAAWNDVAGLRNLVDQVTGYTPEGALAMRALMAEDDENDIQEARYEFQRAASLTQAQLDWSPDKGLRPILAARALRAAGAQQDAYGTSIWRLDAHEILRNNSDGVIGLAYAPPRSWNAQSYRDFVADLQGRLDERDLGHASIVINRWRRKAVLIVKDREFFEKYAPLCGFLPSAATAAPSAVA